MMGKRLTTSTVQNDRTPHATIIIPQFGKSELTRACAQSLRSNEPQADQIIVVDDGSPGEDFQAVLPLAGDAVRVIRQRQAGVTAAWNRAAVVAGTPFLVFLNNDTLVRGPFLERLLEPLRAGRAIVSGVRLRCETALPRNVLSRLPTQKFIEGWCFAVATEAIRALGGFDESLRLYFSDTDLQARVLAAEGAGREALAAMGDLPIVHLGRRTTCTLACRRGRWQADRAAFIRKWRKIDS